MIDPMWLWALPPLIPLGIGGFNLATWPRGRAGGRDPWPRISVCIPARDEAEQIAGCIAAIQASDVDPCEILVLDDGSRDATPQIVEAIARSDPRVRLIRESGPLPEGWIGKVRACHRLSQEAVEPWLLFVDADTRLAEDGPSRLVDLLARRGADAISVVPRQRTGTWAEAWLMPLLHLTYLAWLPMPLVYLSSNHRFVAANGQVVLVRAEALAAAGGFAAIRHELVDDVALFRRLKQTGHRVVFGDGRDIASTRMYASGAALWAGFSKNAYEGIGGHPLALIGVLALYGACFVLPYVLLAVPSLWGPAAVGIAANLLLRGGLAWRYGHTLASVLVHPFAVLVFGALLVNSRRWTVGDRIAWRGRTYVARGRR